MRTTFADIRQSMLPQALGLCNTDAPQIAAYVNEAIWRLIMAGGETGFWGGWQKAVFAVNRAHPYITCPRGIARIINMAPCRQGIRIQNQFYELLEAGIGLQDFKHKKDWCGALEGYDRGTFVTMRDLDRENQLLVVVVTDPRDVGFQMFFGECEDQNGNPIYTTVGNTNYDGFFMTGAQPFSISPMIVTKFSKLTKSVTFGDVLLYQQDSTTGVQVLLSRYAAMEQNPSYRRYYINDLPCHCGSCEVPRNPCVKMCPQQTLYGTMNPNGTVTPQFIGQFYLNLSNNTVWIATGVGLTPNWIQTNGQVVIAGAGNLSGNGTPVGNQNAGGPGVFYLDLASGNVWASTSAGLNNWIELIAQG